jgi:AraC-like DNA-binding protein
MCGRLRKDRPVRYLNLARLDAAIHKLRAEPAKGVTAVAFDCGFQSSHYSANPFRRRIGRTPSEHRERAGGKRRDAWTHQAFAAGNSPVARVRNTRRKTAGKTAPKARRSGKTNRRPPLYGRSISKISRVRT